MQITLLGTGTSTGIPVIGCRCRVCRSDDPRDRRTRCSALVEADGLSIVIDTGPDFRQQALRHDLREVDAVLFTHHHADHIVGMDDLRPFFFGNDSPLPCYAHPHTADVIANTFPYIFVDGTYPGVPNLTLSGVDGPFEVHSRYRRAGALLVEPVDVYHGDLAMYGYRIGRFAYLTDTSRIPESSFQSLEDLDVLVLDALRFEPHPTHFSFDEAIEASRRIGAKETYFVHMTHSILHAEVDPALPPHMHLAYDGLTLHTATERAGA
jgi:phosphoribosyl 1,2-cyclic phosphate phosphodiesterase